MHVSLKSNKGFSLVELMVVVAIIGILAAIAVPNFQRFSAKSKQSEAKASLSAIWGADAAFQGEWQQFTGSFSAMGYEPKGWVRYDHGFTASGLAAPSGYTGPAISTTDFAASAFCGSGAISATTGCGLVILPIPPGAIVGSVTPTASTFTAGAIADISGGIAVPDQWTLDQNKTFLNPVSGLP